MSEILNDVLCHYPAGANECPGCAHYQDPKKQPHCAYAPRSSADSARPSASPPVVAWECTDERYPAIKGIVTDCHATVDAWLQSGIEFAKLGRIIEPPQPVRDEPQTASTLTRDGIARIIEQHVPHDEAVGMANAILALQRSQAESAATAAWECSARKQGTPGGNTPSDCDWPGCGCDPQANKVLEAIDEAGFEIVRKPEIRRMARPQPQANNALRGFGWRSDCPACVASKMVCDAHGPALTRPQRQDLGQ